MAQLELKGMPMIALAKRLLSDDRVRFLLTGAFNTGFGFIMFIAVERTLGRRLDGVSTVLGSVATVLVSHLLASLVAFVIYRRFVFKVQGHVWRDFWRFQSVYALSLAVNSIVLPLAVEWGADRIVAQAVILVVMTVVSYVGHKFFSFRRPTVATMEDEEIIHDAVDGPRDRPAP